MHRIALVLLAWLSAATVCPAQDIARMDPSATCSPKPLRVGGRGSLPHLNDGVLRMSTPTRILYVKPEYSESARNAKAQGIVVLEAQIEPDGRVCNPRVVRSIPLLDQSAIDAVLQWRFTPAKRNGVAVPVITTMTVNFMPR
jgi:TonB family protein